MLGWSILEFVIAVGMSVSMTRLFRISRHDILTNDRREIVRVAFKKADVKFLGDDDGGTTGVMMRSPWWMSAHLAGKRSTRLDHASYKAAALLHCRQGRLGHVPQADMDASVLEGV